MEMQTYLTGPQIKARYGCSAQTLWRWRKDPEMGFPQPLQINKRNRFSLEEIEGWERSRAGKVAFPLASAVSVPDRESSQKIDRQRETIDRYLKLSLEQKSKTIETLAEAGVSLDETSNIHVEYDLLLARLGKQQVAELVKCAADFLCKM